MGLRLHRPAQRARSACAAIGIAALLATGAAHAQSSSPDALGLKGADEPQATPAPSGDAAPDAQSAEPEAKPKTPAPKTLLRGAGTSRCGWGSDGQSPTLLRRVRRR